MAARKKGDAASEAPAQEPSAGPPPGGAPQGVPQQTVPQQGFPPQGLPPQGFPPQGFPQQGFPQQGFPQQGFPQQGFPQQGFPQQGYGPGGYPAQPGMPGQPAFAAPYGYPGFFPQPYGAGFGFPGFFAPQVDPSAAPFAPPAKPDGDPGLDAQVVRPARLKNRVKEQRALPLGNILDDLCLASDARHALGGVPSGCTMVFVGPPGRGKTRTALSSLARVALSGVKCAFVIAEEGFHDETGSGRDDLCSRMIKIGMSATGLDEAAFETRVLENLFVLEAQYHRHNTWDDFVTKYRYLIEKENIKFVIIDSLSMIESKERAGELASPNRRASADNLSALKTYNHEKGVTCICIGQIKDTGEPVGGEALQHTADVVFLIEELTLSSKEMAEQWGGKYRDVIPVIRVKKSVTTPTFPFPVRVDRNPTTGELVAHAAQPADMQLLPKG